MTVSSENKRIDYVGNGSTVNFSTTFRFLQNSDIKVILTVDSTAVETVQVLDTDYTLVGAGLDAGGTVIMTIAPAVGETLTIKRDIALTQGTDYVENDNFPAESHEDALDKLTMITQQIQEELDRSLKLTESEQSSGLTIPSPVTDRFLQWDANGDLQNVDIALQGSLAVSDFAKTYLNDLTAAATRTTLDAMGRVSSGVTDNLVTIDSSDDAKDSGVAIESIPLDAVAGGTVDVITATFSPAFTALNDIKLIRVRATGANATTTPTIAVDGLTAKTIVKNGNQALAIGDIFGADHELLLARNSTNDNYELLNPASANKVIQTPNVETGEVATGTTTIPNDDTIPQNTEGDQFMSLAITPTDAANILVVEVTVFGTESSNTRELYIASLFKDAVADALACGTTSLAGNILSPVGCTFTHRIVAGSTSAQTFKVRAGLEAAGTFVFNGGSGTGRKFGGVLASSITITELTP